MSDDAAWAPNVAPLVGPLQDLLKASYRPRRSGGRGLIHTHARALKNLSRGFTDRRGERRAGYMATPEARAAYLLYYVLTGAATTQVALRRAQWAPPDLGERPLKVLDVGAGPLTASLGVALYYDGPIEVTAVDASRAALQDGRRLMKALRPQADVRLLDGNLRDGRLRQQLGEGYDLILCANVLNEFPEAVRRERDRPSAALKLVRDLTTRRIRPDGRVLLLEPASRSASNTLIRLRDRLVADEVASVLGPCMGALRCPLGGAKARNWCHAEWPWRRPKLVEECDALLGHRRDRLKWSWLYLASKDTPQPARGRGNYRVIGGVMGEQPPRRYLCGAEGRVTAVQTRRDHPLWRAHRGDVAKISGKVEVAHWGERLLKVR